MFQGILRGRNKRKTDDVAVRSRQHHPPVCQELACRSISYILPHYSLIIIFRSNSCKSKGVGLCLPQKLYPNRMMCCLKPTHHPLVFLLLSHHFPYRASPVETGVSDVAARP